MHRYLQELVGNEMRYQLQLLGHFGLRCEQAYVGLPMTLQRLLAFLAISGPTLRPVIIGTLWPYVGETNARGSLRTSMWRLQRSAPYLLAPSGDMLGLGPEVLIDVRTITDSAQTVLRDPSHLPADRSLLSASDELLPGWHDDWVIMERERLRQLRLHALDALAERLIAQRRYFDAMEAALESVRIEPLRESVNRVIIAIHLAEGNVAKALRHYQVFRGRLGDELGVEPSPQMTAMLSSAAFRSLCSC